MSAAPDIVELTVERLGARGDGIAVDRGRTVYLPFTAPGDRVRAEIGARRGEGYAARVVDLLAAGAMRTPPVCRHFGTCGGCAFQHLAADPYEAAKRALIRDALARHGLEVELRPLFRVAAGTRRRTRLSLARRRDGRALVGFNERASHALVDLAECPVQHPELVGLIAPLRDLARRIFGAGEAGAALVTRAETGLDVLLDLPAVPALATLEALADFAERHDLARLAWRAPGEGEPVLAAQRRPVIVSLGQLPVELPIDAFLQATREGEEQMIGSVLSILAGADAVADLFAGVGGFAFALARQATVHAVEGRIPAVASMRKAINAQGLAGRVTVEHRDLERRPLEPDELARFGGVSFDPPRAGAKAQARALARSTVPRIAAISCNPATFARDARTLVDGGYRFRWVQPIDQFLWSPHIELVALFDRAG
jgi:23S rRNA (uracil1939-C5)-methyltransferase